MITGEKGLRCGNCRELLTWGAHNASFRLYLGEPDLGQPALLVGDIICQYHGCEHPRNTTFMPQPGATQEARLRGCRVHILSNDPPEEIFEQAAEAGMTVTSIGSMSIDGRTVAGVALFVVGEADPAIAARHRRLHARSDAILARWAQPEPGDQGEVLAELFAEFAARAA